MTSHTQAIQFKSNFLWFFTLTYTMIIALAGWFDARLVKLFSVVTDAGTLIFPLTFLLTDLITEVYGYKNARRAIWCGFLFNVIFILYGQLIIHLPSPDYPTHNALFDSLLAVNSRIILASIISYFISEPINSLLIAKLKIKLHGRYIGMRFLIATIFASGLDSLVFGTLAFYGAIDNNHLLELILSMWFIKVVIEVLGLPLSVRIANKLKQIEQLDIYDKHTDFNFFRFDTNYVTKDNQYQKK